MLDNVKYITMNSDKYKARQNADGTWVCSELKANTIKELDNDIAEVNRVLNKYNTRAVEERKTRTPKLKQVKGLD